MNTKVTVTKVKMPKQALTATDTVAFWLKQMDEAEEREKTWRKRAQKVSLLYEGAKRVESPFNILYSNTDTLLPALYSSTPRTQAVRRFKDADPLGAAAATAIVRMVDYHLDTNEEDYTDFDDLANQGILEALVPGRGIIRWKYDATVYEPEPMDAKTVQEATDNVPSEGTNIQSPVPKAVGSVSGEKVCGEYVPYDRYLQGYARKWKDVPWVSYLHDMTEDEIEDNFGAEIADNLTYSTMEAADSEGKVVSEARDNRKVIRVYEIWDKTSKSVIFVSPASKDALLKPPVPDPLNLRGFFPQDEPLRFHRKISTMVPSIPYDMYATQAEELNEVTSRITAIVEMMKVRGFYDQSLKGLSELLKQDDGMLIPAENVASLQPGQNLSNSLWMMPLEPLVAVLQQLLQHRINIKQVIYEITGISDILRGSTQASETATAQSIKNKWGTLRLQRMQKIVQKWVRNNLRIIGEIAGQKFSVQTFQKVTGLPYVTQATYEQAQAAYQQWQAQASQQAQMQPQVPGQPPQAPPPPPPQIVSTLQAPVWEAVLQLLRSPEIRSFRLDIETNSTIADDMQEDQKNIGELLNALSQFLNGVTPLIESGAMPFDAAKAIMLAIVRRMTFGPDIEKQIEDMQAPAPKAPQGPPPDPNIQLKSQAEVQLIQAKMQQQKQDMDFAAQEHAVKMEELQQKAALNTHTHNLKMEAAVVKAEAIKAAAMAKPAKPATGA